MERYCFIQIDMDDNQWIIPRQKNFSYNIFKPDIFLKAIANIEKHLNSYPLTLFLVGLDMKVKKKVDRIKKLLDTHSDIEIANHSLSHFNNFNCLPHNEKKNEIMDSDKMIKEALDLKYIHGFRSPGYIFDNEILEILKENNYTYDSSLLPSYFGSILRNFNYLINKIPGKDNFGYFKSGFLPNEPVLLDKERRFFEINVSVCPVLRIPIHYSIIKSKKIYNILSPFIKEVKYFNFLFHLKDFVDVDIMKLKYVLNLITSQRKLVLSKDIGQLI